MLTSRTFPVAFALPDVLERSREYLNVVGLVGVGVAIFLVVAVVVVVVAVVIVGVVVAVVVDLATS